MYIKGYTDPCNNQVLKNFYYYYEDCTSILDLTLLQYSETTVAVGSSAFTWKSTPVAGPDDYTLADCSWGDVTQVVVVRNNDIEDTLHITGVKQHVYEIPQ